MKRNAKSLTLGLPMAFALVAVALSACVSALRAQTATSSSSDKPQTSSTPATAPSPAKPASASTPSATPPTTPTKSSAQTKTGGMVWVNTASGVYHKRGSRWYGKTKKGKYMLKEDAIKAGYKPGK